MSSIYSRPGVGTTDKNRWNSTYTTVNGNSATWNAGGGGGSAGLWVSGFDGVSTTATLSSQFDIALTPALSASGIIYSGCGNSTQWCSAYDVTVGGEYLAADPVTVDYTPSNYTANTADISGHLEGIDTKFGDVNNHVTNIASISANWNSAYTTVNTNSADWDSAYTTVNTTSSQWSSAYDITIGVIGYSPSNYSATTADVSGHLDGIDTQFGYLSGQVDLKANTTTVNTLTSDLQTQITNNDTDILYLSGAISAENLWDLDGTTITPNTLTNTVTLPYLSGANNTITTTTSAGLLQDTTATITVGASAGSIINFAEFAVDPNASERISGDLWITDSSATSGKLLKYFDGTNIYSVELSKE